MIIGITGKSGSGKSFLSEKLCRDLDMIHIDIDKISHEVLSFDNTLSFIHKEFGESVFDDGKLNRKKLGNVVFKNQEKLKNLNEFCQKQIEIKLDQIISSSNKSIILDYALLCWLKQFKQCDVKILLLANTETRFDRVKHRENISREYFDSRDSSIKSFDEFKFDYVFNNISDSDTQNLIKILRKRSNND